MKLKKTEVKFVTSTAAISKVRINGNSIFKYDLRDEDYDFKENTKLFPQTPTTLAEAGVIVMPNVITAENKTIFLLNLRAYPYDLKKEDIITELITI